ncbi:MAG: nucleotidyltransferase family protein [Sphingorhabdus sp.]
MSDAGVLVQVLRNPESVAALDAEGWTTFLTIARAERLIGTLAYRLDGQALPDTVAAILADERTNAEYQKRSALWEANCARRALADYGGKVVLMKGTAYVAAGLQAGEGRHIGDLDIMVARPDLPEVEALLLAAGWEWVKEDAYDDAYYRDHMHELPPLIHKERDRMIDVHHTTLPLTAKPTPDAAGMMAFAVPLPFRGGVRGGAYPANSAFADSPLSQPSPLKGRGLYTLCPTDMFIHSAAHLIADGDLAGGLRNLWDMHCLLTEFAVADAGYFAALKSRARHHQLWPAVHRAARLAQQLYGTEIPRDWRRRERQDKWFISCLTARNEWGQQSRKFVRLIFYIRSHLLRMPPMMLARHLWVKWRKR